MYTIPLILPLNIEGSIYAIQDEEGRTIGTGTREVCELLLHIINRQSVASPADVLVRIKRERSTPHQNVRSAIAI